MPQKAGKKIERSTHRRSLDVDCIGDGVASEAAP
jgi:hypothetical protein